jgi:hypothetical protein
MSTDSTPPSKDTIWQTGLKRKIQSQVSEGMDAERKREL